MANKAVINEDIGLKQQFQKIIQKNYSASIEQGDLTKKAIVKKLNKWVSQETNKLIPQMFTQPFGGNTILVLLNILYFKGLWEERNFEPCKKNNIFIILMERKIRSSSVQKTVIIVDEKGTEAAAVTYGATNFPGSFTYEFILDRPFIFFIRDEEIFINLFVGVGITVAA
ncbi:uncharacterized protein LOC141857615 [Brevipalpus obovatus]|uniref:uncharacterized protein LOC141857615 n=1 Tax=Brevipalpus obovatus TaxID=246614 RepID=UPI003D9FA8B5